MKTKHLIDCDADPVIPKEWSVEDDENRPHEHKFHWVVKHKKMGIIEFDLSKIFLYQTEEQKEADKKNIGVDGRNIRNELLKNPNINLLNANMLDYLLANPDIIPEDWRGKKIVFWGTEYSHGIKYYSDLRYLRWNDEEKKWDWGFEVLGWNFFNAYAPILLEKKE